MKIMVDLDRVVFECPSFMFWIGNKIFTKSHLDKELYYHIVDADKAMGYRNTLFFLKMSRSKNFNQIDKSVEILKKWNNQGLDIHFVSSRPKFKAFQKATVEWLKEKNINYSNLVFNCTNKPLFCKINKFDYIIDDTYKNCEGSFRLGINPIWVRTRQNKNIKNERNIPEAYTWETIDNIIQSHCSNKNPMMQ